MKCPICNAELEQETYYSYVNKDTSYFNYCPECDWDDYPDDEEMENTSITKQQAEKFYRDLCGTVYGDVNKNQQGIMPVCLIADHMQISMKKATEFCDAMIKYDVTEKSCGMIIV